MRASDGQQYLVALTGDGHYAAALLEWMRGGRHPGPYPTADDDYTIAVVIDERNRIWRLGSKMLRYCQVLEKMHASGAGQDYAIGALEAGATAAQAIRIAMKRSDYAGLGVDTVKF